jgi:antitoxin (DNA-binding transcriptional repressor) of toxin-antitoxin stability system
MAKTPTISIRKLQQNLKRVMQRVERGQVIEVTRRRRAVARLSLLPGKDGPPAPWPDLDARARAVFGDRVIAPSGSEIVVASRGER